MLGKVCVVGTGALAEAVALQVKAVDDVMAVSSTDFNEPIEIIMRADFDDCLLIGKKETPHYREIEYNHKRSKK